MDHMELPLAVLAASGDEEVPGIQSILNASVLASLKMGDPLGFQVMLAGLYNPGLEYVARQLVDMGFDPIGPYRRDLVFERR